MKRLMFALSLAFLIGLFALSGSATHAYAFNNSSGQAQLTVPGSYRTVAWHRYWRDDDRDFDRPYVRYYDYYGPYNYYPYPYTYYYGPGFSFDSPFFGIYIP
jgi:hypothetical protein